MRAKKQRSAATVDELWGLIQEEQAARVAQAKDLARLRRELAAQQGDDLSLLAGLGRLERKRLSRAGLLKGLGITAAGAIVAGTGLSLGAPSRVHAAGRSASSAGASVKPNLDSTLGDSYQVLSGLEFMPATSSQGWNVPYAVTATNAIYAGSLSSGDTYNAVLDLPQGATVDEVLFFVSNLDNSVMNCLFWQVDPVSDTGSFLAGAPVGYGASPSQPISLGAPNVVIDNSAYYYVLIWRPGAADESQILYGVRVGYTPTGGSFTPVTPVRVLDTRNGTGGYSGPQGAGAILRLSLDLGSGVPPGASGVVGTLRAYAPSGPGYLTAYPGTGTTPPTASNVNFYPNPSYPTSYAVADGVTVGLEGGEMSIYVGGPGGTSTHVVFDVGGYIA